MYLVIGANGFLGSYILKNIIEKTDDDIIATARNIETVTQDSRIKWLSYDISSSEMTDKLYQALIGIDNIKLIITAAYHNPDLVEKDPRLAWDINITSLSRLINKLENVSCIFYPSTDSVYGNSINGFHFSEEDKLSPVNTYGRQKMTAESIITGYGGNVVRYPFLISPSVSPVKKHFYDKIAETLKKGEKMEMFADSYRSSLSFDTAAGLLVDVIEKFGSDAPKILNICGDDDLSKYDVGLMIALCPYTQTAAKEYLMPKGQNLHLWITQR